MKNLSREPDEYREMAESKRLIRPQFGNSMSSQMESIYNSKTSYDWIQSEDQGCRQLNQRIREANQSYNSTAKPFINQTINSETGPYREPIKLVSTQPSINHIDEGVMSPQLVHKQYNSPIDLYSMSNIRKSIEAQSELLAPGVKGINFMKSESPVNKQSEVYKLIKEEEEERRRQLSSGLSTTNLSNQQQQQDLGSQRQGYVDISRQQQFAKQTGRMVKFATEHESREQQSSPIGYNDQEKVNKSLAQAIQESVPLNQAGSVSGGSDCSISNSKHQQPKCCECGQFIVGPYAKIQDRCIHANCFNCSTCGSSLKNSGYFTINDKLYCDIHARQVANVMRLNYNFEPNRQIIDSKRQQFDGESVATKHQSIKQDNQKQQVVVQRHQVAIDNQHQHKRSEQDVSTQRNDLSRELCTNCCIRLNNRAATISTMFSNRPIENQTTGCGRSECSEIRWTWKPCQTKHEADVAVTSSSAQMSSRNNLVLRQQQELQQNHEQLHQVRQHVGHKHESQLVSSPSSNSSTGVGQSKARTIRLPVCCHCQMQIKGPYILAGDAVWCKPCSQRNFVCFSCQRSLMNVGFIEDNQIRNKYYCEHCFEVYMAPNCAKCQFKIKDHDFLKALGKTWHQNCFVCAHCKNKFGNSSFYLEDNLPYCERDWNILFTTKCSSCNYPIEACDKWIEALERNYHSDCFRCTGCQVKLEGSTFYCKGGKPYCRMHAR